MQEIVNAGENQFIFICCKEYDRDLDIQCSWDENYKISIKRRIEPYSINVFHAIQENENHEGLGDKMIIISMRDNEFNLDIVDPQTEKVLSRDVSSHFKQMSCFWPYLVV